MRFLVDGMLGGLARWLRILGYEVKHDPKTMDNDLIRIAREENMILLTRDKELYQRAIAKEIVSSLVLAATEEGRLAQMNRTFGIDLSPAMARTRCPECGAELIETSKDDVADRVPEASLKLYNEFWKCTNQNCGKVYWVGSHWRQIRQTLDQATKLAQMEKS
jgi:uncharacterized protein